jgi:hypothetical protein
MTRWFRLRREAAERQTAGPTWLRHLCIRPINLIMAGQRTGAPDLPTHAQEKGCDGLRTQEWTDSETGASRPARHRPESGQKFQVGPGTWLAAGV